MKSECIDYRTLPGQNDLFLAYIYDSSRVSSFYPPFPLSPGELKKRVEKVRRSPHLPRNDLVKALTGINGSVNKDKAVVRNLEKLASKDTVAVLTGQQVGLFGGPSFGVYKAASAVKIAAYLEEKGYSAVPVFWLASDDSDFEEVRSARNFDGSGKLTDIRHRDKREHAGKMAGMVSIDPSATRELVEKLRGPSSLDEMVGLIENSYGEGRSFREGFAAWFAKLFGRYGLVLFDPLAEGYRDHLPGFFRTCIEQREQLVAAVQRRNDELEKVGLPVQVRVEDSETFLFLIEPPNRFKLEFKNGLYVARGRKAFKLDREELCRRIEEGQTMVGPGVLLRPILQEYLFPTFGAVLGPAEIAYMAQVNALSRYWDQEIAAIPRSAFTIVDRKAQRILNKYGLKVEQVLKLPRIQLATLVARQGEAAAVLDEIDSLRSELSERLGDLQRKVAEEDPTVAALIEGASKKMHYQIDRFARRFVLNHQNHEKNRHGHLSYLGDHLLPGNGLQERTVNFNSFLVQEGERLVDEIVAMIDPEGVSHQLLYL